MAEEAGTEEPPSAAHAVVAMRVVSPKGARVTETVFVLSPQASARLEIRGDVPARRRKTA